MTLSGGRPVEAPPSVVLPSIVVPGGPKEQVALLAQVQVLPEHEQFPVQVTSATAALVEPQSNTPARTNGRRVRASELMTIERFMRSPPIGDSSMRVCDRTALVKPTSLSPTHRVPKTPP
jgi:hypothetical protein